MKALSIIKWPYWKLRKPWPDHVSQFQYLDRETQRRLAYAQIDKGGFGYWTVFVAGVGFLTDAYDIFAVNTVLPMLGLVYWNGAIPRHDSVLISLSLLVGTFFGQLLLGVLGDRFGRRKVYGWELVILMTATILFSITSKGALAGSNRVAWIASWRFVMGIGIGEFHFEPLRFAFCAFCCVEPFCVRDGIMSLRAHPLFVMMLYIQSSTRSSQDLCFHACRLRNRVPIYNTLYLRQHANYLRR
jgi:hypothetical protein